jgi:sec-independent protein translocase protein TatC
VSQQEDTTTADEDLAEGTLLSHLVELRNRLLRIVGVTIFLFICLLPWSADIFSIASKPLMEVLPGGKMIATEVASPLITPFKLTFFVALFLAMRCLVQASSFFILVLLSPTTWYFR